MDDNPAALYATSRVLRSRGLRSDRGDHGSGGAGARRARDLVVLDVNLPDIDGFEVCRQLRARAETAQLPVLHLSATFTNSADFAQGFEAGADSYLTRPVEAPVLLATVRTLLFARHADLMRRGLDANLRTMFNLAPVAIAILDETLRIESVNPAYLRARPDIPAEELIGQHFDAAVRIRIGGAGPRCRSTSGRSSQLKRRDGGDVERSIGRLPRRA